MPRKPADHGTRSGAAKHRRDETPLCGPCREAERAHTAVRRAEKTTAITEQPTNAVAEAGHLRAIDLLEESIERLNAAELSASPRDIANVARAKNELFAEIATHEQAIWTMHHPEAEIEAQAPAMSTSFNISITPIES